LSHDDDDDEGRGTGLETTRLEPQDFFFPSTTTTTARLEPHFCLFSSTTKTTFFPFYYYFTNIFLGNASKTRPAIKPTRPINTKWHQQRQKGVRHHNGVSPPPNQQQQQGLDSRDTTPLVCYFYFYF
jgi:hypothetical protein